jgi:hypothetical protein
MSAAAEAGTLTQPPGDETLAVTCMYCNVTAKRIRLARFYGLYLITPSHRPSLDVLLRDGRLRPGQVWIPDPDCFRATCRNLAEDDFVDCVSQSMIRVHCSPPIEIDSSLFRDYAKEWKLQRTLVLKIRCESGHPLPAYERSVAFHEAMSGSSDCFVIMVGPSNSQAAWADWSYRPIVDVDDLVHDVGKERACRHKLENHCLCWKRSWDGRPILVVAVHVAYYIQPQSFAHYLRFMNHHAPTKAVVVLNDYADKHGTIGNAPYVLQDDVVVQGAGHAYDGYRHSCDFMGYFSQPSFCTVPRLLKPIALTLGAGIVTALRRKPVLAALSTLAGVLIYSQVRKLNTTTLIRQVKPSSCSAKVISLRHFDEGCKHVDLPLPTPPVGDATICYRDATGIERWYMYPRNLHLEFIDRAAYVPQRPTLRSRICRTLAQHEIALPDVLIDALTERYFDPGEPLGVESRTPIRAAAGVVRKFMKDPSGFGCLQNLSSVDFPTLIPGWFRKTAGNELRAIVNRVLKPRLPTVDGAWARAVRNMDRYYNFFVTQLTLSEYLDTLRGTKKREAQDAIPEVLAMNMALHESKWTMFTKLELNKTREEALDSDPRGIQSPGIHFKTALSPLTLAISERIAGEHISGDSSVFYVSKHNPLQIGDWFYKNRLRYRYCVEVDYSRWDASLGPDAIKAEIDFYERHVGDPAGSDFVPVRDLISMMRRNIRYRGRGQFGWCYQQYGTRRSGDPNTSVGNSLLNAAVNVDYFQDDFTMAVLGDDNLIFCNDFDIDAYRKHQSKFGLRPEVVVHTETRFYRASFCSMFFYPCVCRIGSERATCVLAPKVGRALLKYGLHVGSHVKNTRTMQRSIALSKLPAAEVVPGLCALVAADIGVGGFCDTGVYQSFPQQIDVEWRELPHLVTPNRETFAMLNVIYAVKDPYQLFGDMSKRAENTAYALQRESELKDDENQIKEAARA